MKKHIITKFLFIMIGFIGIFFTVGDFDVAYAVETATTDDTLKWANSIQDVSLMFQKLLYPVLMMIGALIENDLLFGGGMETVLNNIWVPIRNLVNILFILVLVGVALYNVLGLGEEGGEYAIKTALPKIIAALIVINFSFLGMKVLLDGVNALTISILALPTDMGLEPTELESPTLDSFCEATFSGGNFYTESSDGVTTLVDDTEAGKIMQLLEARAVAQSMGVVIKSTLLTPTAIWEVIKAKKGATAKALAETQFIAMEKKRFCKIEDGAWVLTSGNSGSGKDHFKVFNSKNAALVLAMDFNKLGYLNVPDVNAANAKDLLMNALFSLVVYVALTGSFFALFFVLLFRIVFMWVSIAIAPILVLLLFSPTIKDKLGGGIGDIADKFIKNAFAPIPIALALTVGFIMLKAVQTSLSDPSTVTYLGMSPTLSFPVTGLSTPQDLIVMTGTIAVIWMGVFGAAEGTLAEGITGKIKDGVQKVGKGLATLPIKHLPTGLKTADGTEVKAGHLAPLFDKAVRTLNDPMTSVADKYGGAPKVDNSRIKDVKNEADMKKLLQDMGANNQWASMSKTDRKALYGKLENFTETQRKAMGAQDLFKALQGTNRTKTKKLSTKQKTLLTDAGKKVKDAVGTSKSRPMDLLGKQEREARTARSGSDDSSTTTPGAAIIGHNTTGTSKQGAGKFITKGTGAVPTTPPTDRDITDTTAYRTARTELNNITTETAIVAHIQTKLNIGSSIPSAAHIKEIAPNAYKVLQGTGTLAKTDDEINKELSKTP